MFRAYSPGGGERRLRWREGREDIFSDLDYANAAGELRFLPRLVRGSLSAYVVTAYSGLRVDPRWRIYQSCNYRQCGGNLRPDRKTKQGGAYFDRLGVGRTRVVSKADEGGMWGSTRLLT